jgi:hypothetical protein
VGSKGSLDAVTWRILLLLPGSDLLILPLIAIIIIIIIIIINVHKKTRCE